MKERKIAVVVRNDNENGNAFETIDAISEAGYKDVFIQWYDEKWDISQEEQLEYVKKKKLNVIFAHLGYQNINSIWLEGEEGDKLVERYIKNIKECAENNIPLVVMHLTKKDIAPQYNQLGLNRIKKIVAYAKMKNIKIAFENTRKRGFLEYIIENIEDENVGICFDSGHYHVYFNDEFDFAKFKNKIFAVHLHDNDKSDDLHLLPYDGTNNWNNIMHKLKENGYEGPITLEICYGNKYANEDVVDFYKKGFDVGVKLKELIEE